MTPGAYRDILVAEGVAEADRLARYLGLLDAWSARINLTGWRRPEERVRRLVCDVIDAVPEVRAGQALDIGSGNGSPGLVVAILRGDVRMTLLEPRLRRWAFLREAGRVAGVDVDVRRQRHDEYDGPKAETVLLRGLRLPRGEIRRVLEPGGRVISWMPAEDDVAIESRGAGGWAAWTEGDPGLS